MIREKILFSIKKWSLSIRIIPIVLGVVILKMIFHVLGFEYISLSALFTSLIAATTFLLGFLISGVISDYKESEKIPGEMSSSLEALYDEMYILDKNKGNKRTKEFLLEYRKFLIDIRNWFHKKERTKSLLLKLHSMNDYFADFEGIMQPNFLTRMKNEQNAIRKMIIRINNIRDVSFIASAYAIVEFLAFFVIFGLLILKVEPFYEALFFSALVSFLMIYMIFLIKDLDDPFDYSKGKNNGTEVSIKPIYDLIERMKIKENK
ncbi:MAG: hypothetical protein IPN70_03155 [Candidatus Moraniibacteriota bacterium]|nr:MAG: hypothetical protein IPN70_03155 [Candidatus Moranbacteria bacterium]